MARVKARAKEKRLLRADIEAALNAVLNGDRVTSGNYFDKFPTPEGRRIVREEFPLKWYGIFGFHGTGEFMVSDPIAFFKQHPPKIRFEEPDLRNVEQSELYRTMTRIRAVWWIASGLPSSHREMAWLEKHREELKNGTRPN